MMNSTDVILAQSILSNPQGLLMILLPLLGSVLLAYGVFSVVVDLRSSDRKKVVDRLRGDRARRATAESEEDGAQSLRRGGYEALTGLARMVSNFSFTEKFQIVLDQANVNKSAPQVLINISSVAAIMLVVLLVAGFGPIAAIGAAVGAFILPLMYFSRRRKKRMCQFVEQLPDVFELLSQALRAGHSLASGMQLISKQLPDPAGTEFGRVFHEQNLGLKIEDALRNMANRTDLLDVRFFVTAVLIQRQTGGDLAEVLDKISSVIRERIQLFGMVRALTAEGRLSGYVLLALPPLVFFVMMFVNREYANMLIYTPEGKMMTTAAVIMQFMGWAMIQKIVNIKV